MLTLAAVLPLLLCFGGDISGGGVSGGGVSEDDVRSSSESSIGLIARGNAVPFRGSTLAFGDCMTALGSFGGLSSISEFLSYSAGSKVNFVDLVFSSW